MEFIVKLVDNAEKKLIARIKTSGPLTAKAIRSGLEVLDEKRMPEQKAILDGVQLCCAHCGEALYFETSDGTQFAAMPGSVEVKG